MKNHEVMVLKLKRIDVLDVETAIQEIIFEFEKEIRSDGTSEERKNIAQSSIDRRWKPLLSTIKEQFASQDE